MTEAVKKFRQKHHKCVFCMHLDTHTYGIPCISEPWWCKAKKKNITSEAAYRIRPLCTCYEQDGGAE